jgi:hypothetical protein
MLYLTNGNLQRTRNLPSLEPHEVVFLLVPHSVPFGVVAAECPVADKRVNATR